MTTSRQSALLVTPIQNWQGEKTLDLHYKLPIRGIRKLLKSLVWNIVIEGEKFISDKTKVKEVRTYFWIIRQKLEEKIQLGLELELSSFSRNRLDLIDNYLSGKHKGLVWPPDCSSYTEDEFHLDKDNLHEYYGNYRVTNFPIIREVRRPSRYHHKLVVGVGYKDKGSSKDEALDGSPDYQTVSSGYNVKREIAEMIISRCKEVTQIVSQLVVTLKEGPQRQRRKIFIEKRESENFEWYYITGFRFLPQYGKSEITEEDYLYLSVFLRTPYYSENVLIRKR